MFRKIAKLVAYAKSPGKTFIALHPMRAAKMYLAYQVVKRVRSHARS